MTYDLHIESFSHLQAHYAQSKCVVRSADAGPVVHAPQASMHPGTPRGPTSDCLTCAVLTCASKPIACKCVSCIIKKMNYYFTRFVFLEREGERIHFIVHQTTINIQKQSTGIFLQGGFIDKSNLF